MTVVIAIWDYSNPAERTRTERFQNCKKQNSMEEYLPPGIFRDLDEILFPMRLLKKMEDYTYMKKSKASSRRDLHYHLTKKGILVDWQLMELKHVELQLKEFFKIRFRR